MKRAKQTHKVEDTGHRNDSHQEGGFKVLSYTEFILHISKFNVFSASVGLNLGPDVAESTERCVDRAPRGLPARKTIFLEYKTNQMHGDRNCG